MSITGIIQGQVPAQSDERQGGGTAAKGLDDRVRNAGGFSQLAAQNFATTGHGAHGTGSSRTGAQPLNATGRGRIVNIIV